MVYKVCCKFVTISHIIIFFIRGHLSVCGLLVDILEKPYTLGQIEKEEYEERKRTLTDTKNQ